MNARGLIELILIDIDIDIDIGLQADMIEPDLCSILVLKAIVTTLAATPLFHWIVRRSQPVPVVETVSKASWTRRFGAAVW